LAVVTANETDLNLANNIAQITTGVINFTTATLGNATVHNDGRFTLILTGQPGQVYVIQASTNLTSWIPVSTITASSIGKFQYTDTNAASFGRRFYRAALQSAP
ncbi:MAG: Thermophilic serine proteinase, partial [Pedosphaera sp.]|nr:Thermophilic serine proteinase [Pedosphaera sp.]